MRQIFWTAVIVVVLFGASTITFGAELTFADVRGAEGDGPDGKGNTADDTWQFWFELAHARGTFRPFTIHTTTMPKNQRKNGIREDW